MFDQDLEETRTEKGISWGNSLALIESLMKHLSTIQKKGLKVKYSN